jgi:hypothetical protein
MPKILCIASLLVSALVLLLFTLDLFVNIPFGGAGGLFGHLGMMFGAIVVATFSVLTLPECR